MKKHFKIIASCLLLSSIALTSCTEDGLDGAMGLQGIEGEQGIQGEQGPKGDKGDTGADGADGIDGQDGADGSDGQDGADGVDATVVASTWIALTAGDFTTSSKTAGHGDMYDATYNTSLLTQQALDQDVILVYLKLSSGQIVQMPYVYHADEMTAVAYTAMLSLNSLGINVTPSYSLEYTDLTDPLEISVRFVIIPATTLSSTAKSFQKDFKKMSYEEVISYFDL